MSATPPLPLRPVKCGSGAVGMDSRRLIEAIPSQPASQSNCIGVWPSKRAVTVVSVVSRSVSWLENRIRPQHVGPSQQDSHQGAAGKGQAGRAECSPVIGLIKEAQATATFIQQGNAQGFDAPVGQVGQGAQVGKGAQPIRGKGQKQALVQHGGPAALLKDDRVMAQPREPDAEAKTCGARADDCNFHAKGPDYVRME